MNPLEVHIWLISYIDTFPQLVELQPLLSFEERARAERFHFAKDRQQFIIYHGALRTILGQYLHQDPKQICFSTEENGKPVLPHTNLSFNLTHSGSYAMLAVSTQPVGIDLERIDPELPHKDMSHHFMSEEEKRRFFTLPEHQIPATFTRCWTRKEAYVKAIGQGLSYPITQVSMSLSENTPRVHSDQVMQEQAQRWHLFNLNCPHGYKASLVIEMEHPTFTYHTYR